MKHFKNRFYISFDTDNAGGGGGTSTEDKSKDMVPKSEVEKVQAQVTELTNKLNALQVEKDKLAGEKSEEERKSKEKAGEFENLYKEEKAAREKLQGEFDTLKTTHDELDKNVRKDLLSKVGDKQKDFAKDLTTAKLIDFVKLHPAEKRPGTDEGSSGKLDFIKDGKKYSDYTSKELTQIAKEEPELYKKLKKEHKF